MLDTRGGHRGERAPERVAERALGGSRDGSMRRLAESYEAAIRSASQEA
jgi:hypothetical protein